MLVQPPHTDALQHHFQQKNFLHFLQYGRRLREQHVSSGEKLIVSSTLCISGISGIPKIVFGFPIREQVEQSDTLRHLGR